MFTGGEARPVRAFVSRDLVLARERYEKRLRIEWGSPEVHHAFEASRLAESIAVDPHKLGYSPYPCGVAAYRNDLIRQFLTSEIPYLSTAHFEDVDSRTHRAPDSVGPYILEGSKPGAAVAACWLSHRMIPPDRAGYGEILRASLLAARELYERLVHWDTAARANGETLPYRIVAVTPQPPDTNIVCSFVQERPPASLMCTNALNGRLYEGFTLAGRGIARPYSYSQAFFFSRTVFEPQSYSSTALSALLGRAGLDAAEYRQHGLFVLRATVMSPYHVLASETVGRQSLLAELLECLHEKILEALDASSRGPK